MRESELKVRVDSMSDILMKYRSLEQHHSAMKAVIFSHFHFDYIGDTGEAGFSRAEL